MSAFLNPPGGRVNALHAAVGAPWSVDIAAALIARPVRRLLHLTMPDGTSLLNASARALNQGAALLTGTHRATSVF